MLLLYTSNISQLRRSGDILSAFSDFFRNPSIVVQSTTQPNTNITMLTQNIAIELARFAERNHATLQGYWEFYNSTNGLQPLAQSMVSNDGTTQVSYLYSDQVHGWLFVFCFTLTLRRIR